MKFKTSTQYTNLIEVTAENDKELLRNYQWHIQAWGRDRKIIDDDYTIIVLPKRFKNAVQNYIRSTKSK